ncbi:MAG: alpha/beta fold hydrolase [Dehalococcoidia bacterium]|nr:alpha/beta fold hydrolase [Dehalococcoidia bacterium]
MAEYRTSATPPTRWRPPWWLRVVVVLFVAAATLPAHQYVSGQMMAAQYPAALREVMFVGQPPFQMYVDKQTPVNPPTRQPVAIVLIHGCCHTGVYWEVTPDNREGFTPLFLRLGYTVYTVDLPGHGRSPTPPDYNRMGTDRAAQAVAELLTMTGPAVIVGHSMGGLITDRALVAASPAARANVRAAILLAPVSPPDLALPGPTLPETVSLVFDRPTAQALFGSSTNFPREAFDNYFRSLWPESAASANDFQTSGRIPPVGPALYQGIPTIVVHADEDFIPLARSQARAEFFGVEFAVLGRDWNLPGHGHMFMIERNNDRVAARLHQWLQERSVARTGLASFFPFLTR